MTSTRSSSSGQVEPPGALMGILSEAKQQFSHGSFSDSLSPFTTRGGNTKKISNTELCRAPLKTRRPQQQQVSGDRSKQNRSSSFVDKGTGKFYHPSMNSSLPFSAPNKRTGMGIKRKDIKRLPTDSVIPGALLADAYNYNVGDTNKQNESSLPVRTGRSGGKGRRNNLSANEPAQVVMIDLVEGEQSQNENDSNHDQYQQELRGDSEVHEDQQVGSLLPFGGVQKVRENKERGGDSDSQVTVIEGLSRSGDGGGCKRCSTSPRLKEVIPKLSALKTQAVEVRLQKQIIRDSKIVAVSDSSGPNMGVDKHERTGSGGTTAADVDGQYDAVQHDTLVSPTTTQNDESVLYMETTSSYFLPPLAPRESETVSDKVGSVQQSLSASPPDDILTTIGGNQREQLPRGTMRTFVPRCKSNSPDNHGKVNECFIPHTPKKHHNLFAKEQSSNSTKECKTSPLDTKDSKIRERFPAKTLNTTPTLSKECFSFSVSEVDKESAAKESKPNSQVAKNKDVRVCTNML